MPPTSDSDTTNPAHHTNNPTPAGQHRPRGWAWALLGALIVIAVVIAGIIIAGRNTTRTQPTGTVTPTPVVSSSQATAVVPTTTASTMEPTTPVASGSPTVTGPTQVGGWTVEILEYSPNVNDILAAADQPVYIEGHKYVGVKLRITNNGPERAGPYIDLGCHIVGTSKGAYYEHYMDTAGYPGDEYLAEVYRLEPGETGEGWLYYQVPGDFTPTGMVFEDYRIDPDDPPETLILMPNED